MNLEYFLNDEENIQFEMIFLNSEKMFLSQNQLIFQPIYVSIAIITS